MSRNLLIEIPCSDWNKLRDLYVDHKNRSSAFSMIQNFIDWNNKNQLINLNIYSLNGDWKSDGTFILKWAETVIFNTLNENDSRLITALDSLNERLRNYYAVDRVLPAVLKHMENKGFNKTDYRVDTRIWYHLAKDEIHKFEIEPPMGISLDTLNENHIEQVNNAWPHKYAESEKFVGQLIRYNLNVGAFTENHILIGWCLRSAFGSLALLQVVDEHKRKGLGQLVVRAMAKKISASGHEVMAPVVLENIASRKMFEKLGFKAIDKINWVTML